MPHSLRTERLLLRPAILRDAKGLSAALGHEVLTRQTGTLPFPLTEDKMREKLRGMIARQGESEFGFVMMFCSEMIGHLGLGRRSSGDWDVAYAITPAFWGRGLGTEAVQAVCRFGFQVLNLRAIQADVFHDNAASMRILNKCGFRQSSGRAEAHCLTRGMNVPVVNFELVREGFLKDAA
ncbi:GNAT family N-acetyltransferase [Parvularcula marina]|nr:GNAT family N-acetyltransferase [Parvularcula marina]